MSATLLRVAGQFFNQPLLLTPDKAGVIGNFLLSRTSGDASGIITPSADRFEGSRLNSGEDGRERFTKYRVAEGGIAVISVIGELVNRGAYIDASSGVVSYEGIARQLKEAGADTAVKAIIIDMETPGGSAIGCMETGALVREVAKSKPVYVVVNGMMCSAGYAIGSGATQIITTPSGVSGSIGVVMVHADYSSALEKKGIVATLIYSGDHKVDGNPYEALPDAVAADMQTRCSMIYEQFLAHVEQGRGVRFNAEAARATQARYYSGDDAVRLGLADKIGNFESALAELQTTFGRPKSSQQTSRRFNMSEPSPNPDMITKADHDTAVAKARAEAFASGKAEGVTEGATAERERYSAIVNSEHATGRASLAQHFVKSGTSAADAIAALAAAPAQAEAKPNTLVTTMGGAPDTTLGNPPSNNPKALTGAALGSQRARDALGKKQ
jgi:capsid assembly protease